MKKLKSILVVFNGSDSGNGTIKEAVRLANQGNCDVAVAILLPSAKGNLVLVGIKSIREAIGKPALRSTKVRQEAVNETTATVIEEETPIETILQGTNIPEAIINAAKARGCDLIIIGRRGRKKHERSFMESVTARVIGSSPIDVLVMPKDTALKWDNICLAIDGSRCSEVATNRVLDLARNFGAHLNVVSVVDVPHEAYGEAPNTVDKLGERARGIVESVRSRAEALHIAAEVFVREGEAHEKIISAANNVKADVICMGCHGRTGLRRLLMGSVTEKVIVKTTCPVLIVKSC